MTSTKEDGTTAAAAAQQLGSMSEPENNEDADTNGTPTKLCSKCGKESDALMKCRACKCVWYCDKECQNKHWKEHKIECKSIKNILEQRGGKLDIGTELDIGPVGKLPLREECPICMHAMPIARQLSLYFVCCGKSLCLACDYQHNIKAREGNEERVQLQQPPVPRTCAFCREPISHSEEEILARLRKRVEQKDPEAIYSMAMNYGYGRFGLPVDQAKCIELFRESAGLGLPVAYYKLGEFHFKGEMGLELNKEEALKYLEKAAEGGHLNARHNLGCTEWANGNHVAAMRHMRLSASGGYRPSTEALIKYFEFGFFRHDDLAETLQAMYCARVEMRSENRDKYIEHLKRTGEYEESMSE